MAVRKRSKPPEDTAPPHPDSGPDVPAADAPGPTRPGHAPGPVRRFFRILGPGLITGASDDDPSGIGTYSTIGASLGYTTLWISPAILPMMAVVQYICAKVGLVTGTGLAGVLRAHYPRKVLYPTVVALVIANTINAGVDIGAIADSLSLLTPVPIPVLTVAITATIIALLFWGSYRLIVGAFKWLTLSLFSYVAASFFANPDWAAVVHGTLIPTFSLDPTYLAAMVAILGTNISPYLFFWQASQEVEEEKSKGRHWMWQRRGATNAELRNAAWDVNTGMVFSQVVVYFINLTAASTLFASGHTNIQTAADAAQALRPLAGDAAGLLFALGIVGSGFLAVPVLTGSAAYAMSEMFGWPEGLGERIRHARRFYAVIFAATAVGMLINFTGIDPITALFGTAVINGFLAPPLLVLIMLVANNRKAMGNRVNGWGTNILGWAAAGSMFVAAIVLTITWLFR